MGHKEYFSPIIVMLILLGCVFISGCTDQTSETGEKHEAGFFTYENTEYGFKINYTDTWNKQENPQQDILVLFTSPSKEPIKTGSFMVSVVDLNATMNMNWFKQAHIENLSIYHAEFNITYENSTTLAGRQAYTLLFTFKYEIYTFKQKEIWTIEDNTLYLLTYQVDQLSYSDYLDTIDQMINSFEIM